MKKSLGITLIELLVVISIVAIMAAIAMPSLSKYVNQTRLNAIANMLVNDMRAAQSEAIKINRRVLVCAADINQSDCADSADWSANGWLVCVESAGACDVAVPKILIRPPVLNNFAVSANSPTPVTYRPIGVVLNTEIINLSDANTTVSGRVTIAATGAAAYIKN